MWIKNKCKYTSFATLLPSTLLLFMVLAVIVPKGKNSFAFKLHLNKLGQGLEAKVLAGGKLWQQQYDSRSDQGQLSPQA